MSNPDNGYVRPIVHVDWSLQYVWNTGTLIWEPMTQPGGSGGGGDGAILDGTNPLIKAAVKDAVTSPLFGVDPALVVVIRQDGLPLVTALQDVVTSNNVQIANSAFTANDMGLGVRVIPMVTHATETSVASSAVDQVLLASNTSRHLGSIQNDADKALYVRFGNNAATTSAYSVKIPPAGYFEFPIAFSGEVHGIWDAGPTGSARITEFTP